MVAPVGGPDEGQMTLEEQARFGSVGVFQVKFQQCEGGMGRDEPSDLDDVVTIQLFQLGFGYQRRRH